MKKFETFPEESISVCMATYNGQEFLIQQINSILSQLKPKDELIIVDDFSTDNTISLIENIRDSRIKILKNDNNQREVKSFCKAIRNAKNDIIFLSDQDDIWIPGRVAEMTKILIDSGASVISSNFTWINASGNHISIEVDGVLESKSNYYLNNIIDIFTGKTNYYGCAMAFRREFLSLISPIPAFVESHDLWIALASNLTKRNIHTELNTLLKRQHNNNATSPVSTRKLYQKIWSRIIFVASIFIILMRIKSKNL